MNTPSTPGFQYGVSLYSYTDDLGTVLTLEDAAAEIADLGATGIEILGEGNVPGYPEPSTAWIDGWHRLLQTHGLTPTNYGSWIDSSMWRHRDLTVEEGTAILARDLRLAHTLGFSTVRPKIGVVSTDLRPHPIWEGVVERNLDLAADLGIVICPEIHAPTPIRHEVVDGYVQFIERTGTKNFGLLIDTGIFQTRSFLGLHAGLSEEANEEGWRRPLAVPMADLVDVLPHVVFIQAKFFDIGDDLVDQQIPWADVVDTLVEHGYTGWLSSEYEGVRSPYRSLEQVRRQHSLLRSLESAARSRLG
ncbi:sugar phosphate isomerase/epimerase family protein [Kineococcus aurantiacus]|uniref:Sugar phosphate isomerase/epimerase n=1 Tax=Kineococcus aurantiacus TaxID=37633 RepID=A0A7Y9DP58_9ACTN|nr:TIM barrel protein [Kineococcus aurantiacus]NYD24228.1 sugar phosphate isomerase/epimerase [Kineococcus aurantiacus]